MVKHNPSARVRPMWSGTISFGLVSIPVTLWPAVREGRVNMRMLTREGHPLGRRYYSQNTDREIHPEHLIRGYRISDDKFIPITEEELESLAPEKSRDIDLRRFVDRNSIDPMYFERAYFLLPAEGSNKAYRLLAETMEKTSRAGIATFVMRETEYLVAILSDKGILRAEVMRFPDELRKPQDIGLPELGKAEKSQVTKFEHAIQASTGRFKPSLLEDRQKEKLLKLIEQKDKHHKDVVEVDVAESGGDEADEDTGGRSMKSLMAALEESMAAAAKGRKKK